MIRKVLMTEERIGSGKETDLARMLRVYHDAETMEVLDRVDPCASFKDSTRCVVYFQEPDLETLYRLIKDIKN